MIERDFITTSKIVGVTKFNENKKPIQMILPYLQPGERLIFIRDYGNEYDENAIKIYTRNNEHVGYISKELAEEIAPFLDKNMDCDLEGLVLQITGSEEKSYGCNIRIWIERPEDNIEDFTDSIIQPKQDSKSDFDVKTNLIVYGIVLLLVGLLCCIIFFEIWWILLIGVGLGTLGIYLLHLASKI